MKLGKQIFSTLKAKASKRRLNISHARNLRHKGILKTFRKNTVTSEDCTMCMFGITCLFLIVIKIFNMLYYEVKI